MTKTIPDFETQKFEVERFFRFFIEIAKEDFLKNLEYKNYKEREITNLHISNYENLILNVLMDFYKECYEKHHLTRSFSK